MKITATFKFIAVFMVTVAIAGCGCGNGQPYQPTPTATPTAAEPTPTQTHNGTTAELPDTYRYSIHFADQGGMTATVGTWVKGDKLRNDYSITPPEEDTDTTVFIGDGQFDWVYDPDENRVTKYNRGAGVNPAAYYSQWFTYNYYGAAGDAAILSALQASCSIDPECRSVEKTGYDTVAGQACTVFTVTGNEGRVIEYCISAGGYPLRISLTDFGFTSTMIFTDIDLNPDIPESIFDIHSVAPGAQIIDNT